jgi:hypothetical protein
MATVTASGFGALGDDAPLHLPMPGLFADVEAGSGAVALTDDFLEAALVDMFREFAAPLRGLTIVEQIERFRIACNRRGVDCPPEFPVLLQRF